MSTPSPHARPPFWKNPKIIALAFVLAVGGCWYLRREDDDAQKKVRPPAVISVAPVTRGDVPIEIREPGTVVAYETVAVRSRLDSQVAEVRFKDGDAVKKGDLLFVLDDRTLQAQVKELEANLNRDRAQAANLRAQYARIQKLTAQGFESKANLDTSRAAYEAASGTVGASEAALNSARVQLGYTRITAPIDGRTGTIAVTVGNTVKANDTTPLVTINTVTPIRARASLAQANYDALRKALTNGTVDVLAQRQDGGEPVKGTLEYLDNAVDETTGTFAVRARFDNTDETLWPGMFVTLVMRLGVEQGALTIPEVAIQHDQTGEFVYLIADGKATKQKVKTARTQDDKVVITEGLQEGQHVASDGFVNLKNGATVTVKDKSKKP